MHPSLLRFAVLAGATVLLAGPGFGARPDAQHSHPTSAIRPLTFEERLDAQRAIERVYYSHQIDARLPFDEAIPRAVLERKVWSYLKSSAALRDFWKSPITAQALDRELERIASNSRFPDRLREIYDALGRDSFVVRETLVRATLAERLARNFFALDQRLHATERAEAESLREDLAAGRIDPQADHPGRTVQDVVVKSKGDLESGRASSAPSLVPDGPPRLDMDPEEFHRWRSEMPLDAGAPGPVEEERDSFVVRMVLSETAHEVRTVSYAIPKMTFEAWRSDASTGLDERSVDPVASPDSPLPPAAGGATACDPDDTWSNTSLDRVPETRSRHTAVWTGNVMIVWGGWRTSSTVQNTGGRYDPLTDTWAPTSLVNAPSIRVGHTAIWTGQRMVAWGGYDAVSLLFNTGGQYDPVADTWTPTTVVNAPVPRASHSAVWTGTRMLVWGGTGASQNTGGSYDPAANMWTPMSIVNAPDARSGHTATWTGSLMVVWGGHDSAVSPFNTGGRYDPVSDTWLNTSTLNAPTARMDHTAVWSGMVMIVWGGYDQTSGSRFESGGLYDPAQDTWTATSLLSAPQRRLSHSAVWTGSEMIVWGGICDCPSNSGGRYNPETDTWSETSSTNAPSNRSDSPLVWTGNVMIAWGGRAEGSLYVPLKTGGRYDPATDSWTPTSMDDVPQISYPKAVWTGNEMLVWVARGGRYDPLLDTWLAISTLNAPTSRFEHSAVWDGQAMTIWGGVGYGNEYLNDGGRYFPVTDSWTLIPSQGPTTPVRGRSRHSAVWTGRQIIVWGGYGYSPTLGPLGDGAAYYPSFGSGGWGSYSNANAPTARYGHSAVWTGSRMLIWGGGTNTGAAYNPEAGIWTPISTINAPSPRTWQSAVWTGTEMLIWGGTTSSGVVQDGGRYNPATDSWAPLSVIGAPSPRLDQSAVWTGRNMVVWGGRDSAYLNTGGRYDPATDSWSQTSAVGAPTPRIAHAAVWTGTHMIIWGGRVGGASTDTGGLYALDQSTDVDGDGFTVCEGDCNDLDPAVHPGATEICDGQDSDCDGDRPADEADSDYDGFRICAGDCFDQVTSAHPGAPELCNGQDDNCDGLVPVDEVDADGDGYCAFGDCNDGNPAVHPNAAEPCNRVDDDCDGVVDDGWPDLDGDGRPDCSDCRPEDPSLFEAPGLIANLRVTSSDPLEYQWDSMDATAGSSTVYDVFSGFLSSLLGVGDFSAGSCLASDLIQPGLFESFEDPPAGDGVYLMVRGRNGCGEGSFGSPDRDAGTDLSPYACP